MSKDEKSTSETKSEALFEGQLDKLLESLKSDLFHELLEGNSNKLAKNAAKTKMVDAFTKLSQQHGEKIFFTKLGDNKELMKSALECFGEVDHDNKSKMHQDLKKKYQEIGQEAFFKKMNEDILTKFCEVLEFKEEGSKDDVIAALGEEIIMNGTVKAFDTLNKEFAIDVAKNLKLKTSGSKQALINRIVGQVYPHLLEDNKESEKPKKKKERPATDKKAIEKGVTIEDLYQYYTSELVEYCVKNGLKKTGTKKELTKRILKFLAGDVESTRPKKPGESKKRRRRTGSYTTKKKKKPKKKEEGEEGEKKDAEKKDAAEKPKRGRKRKAESSDEKQEGEKDAKKSKK